jgi:hypothetical protein
MFVIAMIACVFAIIFWLEVKSLRDELKRVTFDRDECFESLTNASNSLFQCVTDLTSVVRVYALTDDGTAISSVTKRDVVAELIADLEVDVAELIAETLDDEGARS